VNDAAVIGNAGNPNTVKLTYSNNPGHSGDGNPDNPDSDIVTGETPDSVVKTYVTEIELIKVDGANNTTKLAGAVFNVKGTQINKVIITGEKFVKDAAGTYYLLKDGTYTTKTPTDATISQYESTSDMYKKEAYATTSEQETKDVDFQVVTGSDGIIKLTGLKEGTYTFTEIQAPDGYNLLKDPITVTITSNVTTTDATFAWTGSDNVTNKSDGTFTFNVANNSGTELPSTGGIGTTIFYIVGGLLLVGAAIVLVARRKASN
jgi:LPXTG-motif cell wall-anchored protein